MSPVGWGNQAVYLQSGDPEQENTPTLAYKGTLGTRFTVVQPTRVTPGAEAGRSKTYQLVKTDSSMSVAPFPGAVAFWSDKTGYVTTTTVTTLGRGRIAGVYQNAITPGNYGCIQTEGPATVKFIDTVTQANLTTAGNFVIPSATAGKADVIAAGSSSTYPSLGLTAGTMNLGDNTAVVDLDVPQTT
jgi:hypothetical protein